MFENVLDEDANSVTCVKLASSNQSNHIYAIWALPSPLLETKVASKFPNECGDCGPWTRFELHVSRCVSEEAKMRNEKTVAFQIGQSGQTSMTNDRNYDILTLRDAPFLRAIDGRRAWASFAFYISFDHFYFSTFFDMQHSISPHLAWIFSRCVIAAVLFSCLLS